MSERVSDRVRVRGISNTVHVKGLPVSIGREDMYTRLEGFGKILGGE